MLNHFDDGTFVETHGCADKVQLELNTLGESDERAEYRAALVEFLKSHKDDLDEDSQRRLTTNPLRILDSKDARTQQFRKCRSCMIS
jgi:histidyl-tRNA synthetase